MVGFRCGKLRRQRFADDGQALPFAVIVMVIVLMLVTGESLVLVARFRQDRIERANAHLGEVANWAVSHIDDMAATSYDLDEVLKKGGKAGGEDYWKWRKLDGSAGCTDADGIAEESACWRVVGYRSGFYSARGGVSKVTAVVELELRAGCAVGVDNLNSDIVQCTASDYRVQQYQRRTFLNYLLHYASNGVPARWGLLSGSNVAFHKTDTIKGSVHTNEISVLICGEPTFSGQVETGGPNGAGSWIQASSGCDPRQPSSMPMHTGQLLVQSYSSDAACDTRGGVGGDGLTAGTQWLRDAVRRVKGGIQGWIKASTVDWDNLPNDVHVVWSDGDLELPAKGSVNRPVTLIASRDIIIKANNATTGGATYVHGAVDQTSLLEATGTDTNGRKHVLALIAGCDVRLQFDRSEGLTELATETFIASNAPVLTVGNITATTADLTIANHTGPWYYKETAPASGTCTSVSAGTTVNLASLTQYTSYTYKAYSDLSCTTELATETFIASNAPVLTVGNITATTADLTIANHTGPWYYKETAPALGTCTSVSAGTTVNLASLTQGTSYTYEAYSNSSCSTADPAAPPNPTDPDNPGAPWQKNCINPNPPPALDANCLTWEYYYQPKPYPPGPPYQNSGGTFDYEQVPSYSSPDSYPAPQWCVEWSRWDLLNGLKVQTELNSLYQLCDFMNITLRNVAILAPAGGIIADEYYIPRQSGQNPTFTVEGSIASKYRGLLGQYNTKGRLSTGYRKDYTYPDGFESAVTAWWPNLKQNTWEAVTSTPHPYFLTVSGVTSRDATLTISNHTGDWYYQQAYPLISTGSPCIRVNAGTITADLNNLSSGTFYTYKTFTDSGCSVYLTSTKFVTAGLLISPMSVTVNENSTATYTVTLTTKPTSDVTINISGKPSNDSDIKIDTDDAVLGYQNSLAFTATDWNTSQTVTVSAASDPDSLAGTAEFTHTASSSDTSYNAVTKTVAITENEVSATLTSSNVTSSGARLTIGNHSGGWYYKKTVPTPAGSCISVAGGTSEVDLSGLDAAKAYTYRAYSDSGCSVELASESFTTLAAVTLTSSNVTSSGARLTIGNHSGGWYYKKTVPTPAGSCISVAGGTSEVDLSGLDAAKAYTYRAYSDSGCSVELASESFTTLAAVTLTSSNVTSSGARLTIGNHSGGWYYKKTVPTPAGSCISVAGGTSEVDLSGLDAAKAYTYRAYSDSGCSVELASESFTTLAAVTLTSSNVTSSGARLTIGNHSGGWYYKKTVPTPAGSCISVAGGTSEVDLSGLDAAKAYTYRAYSDSGCSVELASESFTTLAAVTLTSSNVTSSGARLTIGNHSGGWYYKKTVPTPAGSCISVAGGTSEVDLSGLDAAKAYTYRAYSDSGCSVELASESFTTLAAVTLTSSNVTSSGARLTIGNHSGGWYYKKTVPTPAGSCISVAGGTSEVDLSGLDAAKAYTYRAYSDSGCSVELASESFTTLAAVTLTSSNVTSSGARLTIGNHSGGWYYKKTVPTPAGSCISVAGGTSEVDLSGLDAAKAYTYRAYSDSGCSVELASESFTTLAAVTLTSSNVTSSGARLTIGNHSGGWYYKKTVPTPAGSCISVAGGTSEVDLSGLDAAKAYTYRAYSDSGCSVELASESFTTLAAVTLTSSNVTSSGAQLTIGNHSGGWYYKKTAPTPAGSCISVASGTSEVDISQLSLETAYTYKAYSDSGCSVELASESFTTLVITLTAVRTQGGTSADISWTTYPNTTNFNYYQVIICTDAQHTPGQSCNGNIYQSGPIWNVARTTIPNNKLTFTLTPTTGYGVILQVGLKVGSTIKIHAVLPAP